MTTSKEKKYLEVIHHCENVFGEWIHDKIPSENKDVLTEVEPIELHLDYNELPSQYKQFIEHILEWNNAKKTCYKVREEAKMDANSTEEYFHLLEKTSFDGMLLLMTFQK